MVELEVGKNEPLTVEGAKTKIDVTKIINTVKNLVDEVKEMAGKPMDVKLENFEVAFSKEAEAYNLSLHTKIVIKEK